MRHINMVLAERRFILTYDVARLTFPILDGTTKLTLRLTTHIELSMKRRTVGFVRGAFDTLVVLECNMNEYAWLNKTGS